MHGVLAWLWVTSIFPETPIHPRLKSDRINLVQPSSFRQEDPLVGFEKPLWEKEREELVLVSLTLKDCEVLRNGNHQ